MKAFRLVVWVLLAVGIGWVAASPGRAASAAANQPGSYHDPDIAVASSPEASSEVVGRHASALTPEAAETPQPTPSPFSTPPPSDRDTTQLMVLFGVFLAIIILIGIGINSRRVF